MARITSKILNAVEAKESDLHSKIVEQEKILAKAEKALAKEQAVMVKLETRLAKSEEKRKPKQAPDDAAEELSEQENSLGG